MPFFLLDKNIKDRTETMIKRKKYTFRKGGVIEVEEFHSEGCRTGGKKRGARDKPTPEQMQKVNAQNKARRCRHRLLEYFSQGDCFATLTYEVKKRPQDMQEALKDFQKTMREVRKEYRKRGYEVYWIRNIEKGTRGAWHIHLVINEIGETASILQRAWKKGGTWSIEIRNSQYYDEDFTKLANYMTKDEKTEYMKKDGTCGKTRMEAANYNTSRNMPLPAPEVTELKRWQSEPKPKKGYYIAKCYEGINATGYRYRRYTMLRLKNADKDWLRSHPVHVLEGGG